MGISNMVKNAAGRYLGRSGTGTTPTTGRTRGGGMNAGRRGTPMPSGKVGGILRNLLNRR
ncbi:hypothetical protein ACX80U_13040 [Arthrobacter sp. TmT3-37]|uniref:Uncharacterized protein n=1 Tax=Arthrobacter agilis TaxID=37921 RepID=A0A2L0UAI3_9MICC|nr:hypothetical protein [Arthrobacter agilis]AUZ86255.1 hypothetical protein CVO76_00275 [Arthrobacter agilis]BBE21406.1 hypothetical protein MN0502_02890 [Arthrobacter sp. MN05-02]